MALLAACAAREAADDALLAADRDRDAAALLAACAAREAAAEALLAARAVLDAFLAALRAAALALDLDAVRDRLRLIYL